MSYLETLETRELLLLSSSLLSQYNTTRMNFENKAKHYGTPSWADFKGVHGAMYVLLKR